MAGSSNKGAMLKQRGFTLFETIVVVLAIGVFMTEAIDRMLRLQVDAEHVSVKHVIGTLQSAVNLQAAEMVTRDGLGSLRRLENTNPVNYLQKVPYTYLGVKSDSDAATYPGSSWYYDADKNILFYKVKNKKYFESSINGVPRIRLKIELVYDEDGRKTGNSIRGVVIKSLDDYRWLSQY